MGEVLSREFNFHPVDTGKTTPPTNVPLIGPMGEGLPSGSTMQIPGVPVTRPSFLQAFLANLGPALGQSFAASGDQGQQNFGTAFAGGMAGIQNYKEKQFQRAQQIQEMQQRNIEMQMRAAQQQSTQALQAAQTNQLNQYTPLEVQQKQMELKERQGLVDLASNPLGVEQMLGPMTQSLKNVSPDEQAILDSAKGQVVSALKQGTFNVDPYKDAVTKIAQDRIQTTRKGESPDAQQQADWLKQNPYKTVRGQQVPTGPADFLKWKTGLAPSINFNLQAQGLQGTGTPPAGPGGAPLTYDQQIKSFGAKGGIVKAILEGRQDAPASFAQKSPYWQDVMQKVYSVDPDFNQQRAELRKDYTVGRQSIEIKAVNTALGHIGVLGDAIDALNNGNVQILNSLANRIGVQTGDTPVTTFNTIVHRVGPELSKAYIGAGGSAGERGTDEKDFDPSLGAGQLKSNVGISAQLLRSKIGALENQWDQNKSPNMKSFEDQFISPEAKKQLDRWAPGGKSVGAAGPGGHVIAIGNNKYQYKGTGDTADLTNYQELK
jgi:hypothetical protein